MAPAALPLGPADVVAIAAVLPTIALAAFGVRVFDKCRKRAQSHFGWDDWTLTAGLVMLWALAITCFIGVGIGALGKHSPPLGAHPKPGTTITRTDDDVKAEKIVRGYSIMEKVTFFLIKSSVVLSYRRVFSTQVLIQRLTAALLAFLALQTIAFMIAGGMQCSVRSWAAWYEGWTHDHHCTSALLVWVGFSVTDVFTDLVLVLLPIPPVIQLHMKKSKKIMAIGMLVLGSLSAAIGIARMGYLIHFTWDGTMGYRDLLGLQTTTLMFSLIEASVAVVAACLASMRRLLMQTFLKSKETSSSHGSRKYSDAQPLSSGGSKAPAQDAVIALDEV